MDETLRTMWDHIASAQAAIDRGDAVAAINELIGAVTEANITLTAAHDSGVLGITA